MIKMREYGGTRRPEVKALTLSALILVAALIAADQITKYLICPAVIEAQGSLKFIPGLLRFEYTENTGMAWGIFKNGTVVLGIFSLIACAGIVFFLVKKHKEMPITIRVGLLMVLAGALGNLYDRFALGYVRDFIAFDFVDFPIFNLADACVTIGAILMLAALILTKKGRAFVKTLDDGPKKGTEGEANKENEKDRDSGITEEAGQDGKAGGTEGSQEKDKND